MRLKYLGNKSDLILSMASLMDGPYNFSESECEVSDFDGNQLMDENPNMFEEVASVVEEKKGEGDSPIGDGGGKEPDLDKIDFDIENDRYLCPLCDKTYAVNKGRGKHHMVEHLEDDHANEWAKMLESANEE